MYRGSASAGSQDYHLTPDKTLLPSSILGKKQAWEKRVSHRGTAFIKEEDSVLCSVFLNISKDPITGVNQNMDAYYKRIYDYYHEHKQEGENIWLLSWAQTRRLSTEPNFLTKKVDHHSKGCYQILWPQICSGYEKWKREERIWQGKFLGYIFAGFFKFLWYMFADMQWF
jgi:hypothetical protein